MPGRAERVVAAIRRPPEIIESIFDIDMGYWTEVDVPTRVTIDHSNERIAITDLDNDEDVYVYKATDSDVMDFMLDFEFQVLTTSVNAGAAFGVGVADGVGTMEDVDNGLYVQVRYGGGVSSTMRIMHMTSGAYAEGATIADIAVDTVYYGRLIRRGSYCWLGLYTDYTRETHHTGSPVEYKDVTPVRFSYLYPMTAVDDGVAGNEMDAYIQAIKLTSAPDIDNYIGKRVE